MIASPSDSSDNNQGPVRGAFEAALPHPSVSMAAATAVEPEEVGGKGSRLRRCIVTGEVMPHDEMIRFVISPEGVVTPDLENRLPGRGHWVVARHNELFRAVSGDAFTRAARARVAVPPALIANIITQVRRSCLNTLGLARRDWAVEFGYDNVRQAVIARKSGLLLLARNAPTEIQQKLMPLQGDLPVIDLFTTAEMSSALGRDSLAFASINKGQWTTRMLVECRRLTQLLQP